MKNHEANIQKCIFDIERKLRVYENEHVSARWIPERPRSEFGKQHDDKLMLSRLRKCEKNDAQMKRGSKGTRIAAKSSKRVRQEASGRD